MAAKKKTSTSADLAPQTNPRAPLDSKLLLRHLTRLLKVLEQDLLARADSSERLTEALQASHAKEVADERTADSYDTWRRDVVTQVAAAWVLNVVFIRILEDRGLIEHRRIAGPGALASERQFLELAPYLTERDYLLTIFQELSHFEVTREIFDRHTNLAFRITPSADGAKQLLAVFRLGSADAPALRFGQADTRFLGDLYQDLSESVRKKYALLQTPDFVEGFILDRTLEPALETYGLDATTLIDPTCGSGHFLLGAFERLFDRQLAEHPNQNSREAALKALRSVYGTDINPYAASIAKFRLVLAFLEKAGFTKLAAAPPLPLNVVTADSLDRRITGGDAEEPSHGGGEPKEGTPPYRAFTLEDRKRARQILAMGFAAVVGNPPYITVKDNVLREQYRQQYESAAGKYVLAAPFAERFFRLCRPGAYTGMITANSFMKREFGKRLVEQVLPKLDLQLVVNTSGAYIPGHGTPTVLLFGQNQAPKGAKVRTVLAKRGEPRTPANPAEGHVWSSVVEGYDAVGFENEYISVVETERATLGKHPWTLGGGGATELKGTLEERAERRLSDIATAIGFDAIMGEDEIFFGPPSWLQRMSVRTENLRHLAIGENVRDWALATPEDVLFPYDEALQPRIPSSPMVAQHLWAYRTALIHRQQFGKNTLEAGLHWFEYRSFYKSKRSTPLSITFAFVATHNHFVLDRGGKVFNRSAPIIKLPETATEDDHYALLAYLNSSTACFWMKQVMMNKGATSHKGVLQADEDKFRYEFDGTKLKALPLPPMVPGLAALGQQISDLMSQSSAEQYRSFLARDIDGHALASAFIAASDDARRRLDRACSLQEKVDRVVYELMGLCEPDMCPDVPASLSPSERSFLSPGPHWWQAHDHIALIENAQFKRRWYASRGQFDGDAIDEPFRQRQAIEEHILDKIESAIAGLETTTAQSLSPAIAPEMDRCREVAANCHLDLGSGGYVSECLSRQCIPYLAALRYTPTGVEKHAQWLKTWELQRREDRGESVGAIAVPPKYKPEDLKQSSYWSLRGKLDVPKERFISYPGCESDEDKSPVYGWAGWNHLQRAQALAALYEERKQEGWDASRRLPMLVGLLELLPWLHQYHGEPDEALGGERPAEQYEAFLAEELRQAGKTRQQAEQEVLAWAQGGRAKTRKARAASAARASAAEQPDVEHDQEDVSPISTPAQAASRAIRPKPPRKAKARDAAKAANDFGSDQAPASARRSSTPPTSSSASGHAKAGTRRSKGTGR
jgi:hypothetical protein